LQLYTAAFYDFQEAVAIESRDSIPRSSILAATWAGIGNASAKLQQYQQAVEAYEEALRLDDTVTLDYDELVRSLMAIGRVQEAERYREQAKELGYYDEE
jgi:tetratricopeptide (TPR) repeat protein